VKTSPCVSQIAHGIERSPWPASPCGVRRELTHGESSAVCLGPFAVRRRHTAYDGFSVVISLMHQSTVIICHTQLLPFVLKCMARYFYAGL
jgi:hypothetical protein